MAKTRSNRLRTSATRKRGYKRGNKMSPAKALSQPQRRAVVAIVNGQSETKRGAFYETYNDGTVPIVGRLTGLRSARGFAVQNNAITNNTSDILQLIPYIPQGIDNWQRIGNKIRPSSLIVNGTVRVNTVYALTPQLPTNIRVVIYVLQSVQFKDYDGLLARNDFTNLLDTDEGTTVAFRGEAQDLNLSVSKQNYKLLQKKVLTLRYGGVTNTTGSNSYAVSVSNSHTWYADYTLNLGKHLPKVLVYPEEGVVGALPPATLNSPTNSSIFMCMGCIDWNQGGYTNGTGAVPDPPGDLPTRVLVHPYLEQTYVSHMGYKDL